MRFHFHFQHWCRLFLSCHGDSPALVTTLAKVCRKFSEEASFSFPPKSLSCHHYTGRHMIPITLHCGSSWTLMFCDHEREAFSCSVLIFAQIPRDDNAQHKLHHSHVSLSVGWVPDFVCSNHHHHAMPFSHHPWSSLHQSSHVGHLFLKQVTLHKDSP